MVQHKTSDQYPTSGKVSIWSIHGFKRYSLLKTLTKNFNIFCNANTDAVVSAIALHVPVLSYRQAISMFVFTELTLALRQTIFISNLYAILSCIQFIFLKTSICQQIYEMTDFKAVLLQIICHFIDFWNLTNLHMNNELLTFCFCVEMLFYSKKLTFLFLPFGNPWNKQHKLELPPILERAVHSVYHECLS